MNDEPAIKLGAILPINEIGHDVIALRDWAQAVEEMGFDRIIAYDHVLGAVHDDRDPPLTGPYTEADPFHEVFVTFGFLAALTRRVELMTGVLVLPQRQTALVAKQAVQVEMVSGGRFTLGLGTGWNHVEYESLNMPFDERGPLLDEQVEVLRLLFEQPVVTYSGRFHTIDRAGLCPLPRAPIPIWFGGWSKPALRRAARLGDGFLFGGAGSTARGQLEMLREMLVAEGRDPSSYPVDAQISSHVGPDAAGRTAAGWAATGAGHISISTMVPRGEPRRRSIDDHLGALATTRQAVLAAL